MLVLCLSLYGQGKRKVNIVLEAQPAITQSLFSTVMNGELSLIDGRMVEEKNLLIADCHIITDSKRFHCFVTGNR